jgi:hypothetical protein
MTSFACGIQNGLGEAPDAGDYVGKIGIAHVELIFRQESPPLV